MSSTYLLVGNPTAQSGKAQQRIERTLQRMRQRGMAAQFLSTQPEGRTVPLIAERLDAGGVDVVIYLGGDGTFAEVAKGILAANEPRPLGMLPSGTANDQGRSFGIKAEASALDWNLDVIEAGWQRQLDVGRVGRIGPDGRADVVEHVFHSVGWGLQPEILRQRNEDRVAVERIPLLREIYRDQAVYAGAALNRLLASWVEPSKFAAEELADGVRHRFTGLSDLVINATPVYGGAWVLDRHAEPDDGLFELIPIKGRREWASIAIRDLQALPLWQEQLDVLGVTHSEGCSAAEFDVELLRLGKEKLAAQVDGEEWVEGVHFKLSVLPRALSLIVPAEWEPPWKMEEP